MSRLNRSKHLPYLVEYVQHALDWRPDWWQLQLTARAVLLGIAISTLVGLIAALSAFPIRMQLIAGFVGGIGSLAIYFIGMYALEGTRRARQHDPQREVRREAKQVAQRLAECAAKKRLHRDLSIEVASVLEEAARNWHRARSALESPYWKTAELPAHLRLVRDQSLQAIDQGMQELLLLFATSVPEEPSNWSFGELVDEVVGHDIFAVRGRREHISPFYDQGRGVAAKLMELADQVEAISRQLAGQELITGAPRPGSGLEATLAELRQIKQAEEELRQDLRG